MLCWVIFLCSLAVLTDAAHLLSDVSGFAVALFANYVASQSSTNTHTFGWVLQPLFCRHEQNSITYGMRKVGWSSHPIVPVLIRCKDQIILRHHQCDWDNIFPVMARPPTLYTLHGLAYSNLIKYIKILVASYAGCLVSNFPKHKGFVHKEPTDVVLYQYLLPTCLPHFSFFPMIHEFRFMHDQFSSSQQYCNVLCFCELDLSPVVITEWRCWVHWYRSSAHG